MDCRLIWKAAMFTKISSRAKSLRTRSIGDPVPLAGDVAGMVSARGPASSPTAVSWRPALPREVDDPHVCALRGAPHRDGAPDATAPAGDEATLSVRRPNPRWETAVVGAWANSASDPGASIFSGNLRFGTLRLGISRRWISLDVVDQEKSTPARPPDGACRHPNPESHNGKGESALGRAPRIQGELLKLGIDVCQATVREKQPAPAPSTPSCMRRSLSIGEGQRSRGRRPAGPGSHRQGRV